MGEALTLKAGVADEFTVSARVVVAFRLPEVPVIVTVAVPVVAVALAVNVSTLVPVVGLVPNVAVTPLGRPESTDKVTLLLKPPDGVMVIVLAMLVVPWLTLKVAGDAARVKLGATATVTGTLPLTPP